MKRTVMLSLALLATFAIHARAEQGDAEDRALNEEYAAQQRAQTQTPPPAKVATSKQDKAPTAASAP